MHLWSVVRLAPLLFFARNCATMLFLLLALIRLLCCVSWTRAGRREVTEKLQFAI
jgi:hypothetical protein